MSYTENAKKLKEKVDANQKTIDLLEAAGGIRTTAIQSDKIGYDWVEYYVNGVLVRRDYVEQKISAGTADNPIVWKEGMHLIPNAYYVYDSVRKVWMGEQGVVAGWDDDRWELF